MKNLVVFDIETTGLDKTKDQIIQFAALKIDRTTHQVLDSINEYIQPSGSYSISISAYLKHGIKPDFLKDKPHFKDVANKIYDFFNGCDILTYNGNSFDISFLINEFNKVGITFNIFDYDCYDAFLEEKRRNGNNLESTYQRYKGKSMEESGLTAHNAYSDVKATYSIFVAQQKIKEYGPEKIYGEDNIITEMLFDGKYQPCFSIGKYRGIPLYIVKQLDKGYLDWCISDKSTFMPKTKQYIRNYLNSTKPLYSKN